MNPSSVRWSELTEGGMRSASQTRHLFSSGASRLPCARPASRNSGSPITLLSLSCLNCLLCAEAQRPARISANLEEAAVRRDYLPPGSFFEVCGNSCRSLGFGAEKAVKARQGEQSNG